MTCSKTSSLTHRRGDTWSRVGIAGIKDHTGAAMNLTGWTVRSQGRHLDTGALVAEFVCTLTDPVAQTYTHVCNTTTQWPDDMECDVQFTSPSGFVVSTPVFRIRVDPDVTQPTVPA